MPIERSANGAPIVVSGHGDIYVCRARREGEEMEDEIVILPDTRRSPVGSRMDDNRWAELFAGRTSDELDAPVRFRFDNLEGLDSLIMTLIELRFSMESGVRCNLSERGEMAVREMYKNFEFEVDAEQ